jgi:hypothetical protein
MNNSSVNMFLGRSQSAVCSRHAVVTPGQTIQRVLLFNCSLLNYNLQVYTLLAAEVVH